MAIEYVQKTIRFPSDLWVKMKTVKEMAGLETDQDLYTLVIGLGVSAFFTSPLKGEEGDDEGDPMPIIKPQFSFDELNAHLTAARLKDDSLFKRDMELSAILPYEQAISRLRELPLSPLDLHMVISLFKYHYISKVAYLYYLCPLLQLREFSFSLLLPPYLDQQELSKQQHPLLTLLVDVAGVLEFDHDQQEKIKELLLALSSPPSSPSSGGFMGETPTEDGATERKEEE